jgi:hypothetical protein
MGIMITFGTFGALKLGPTLLVRAYMVLFSDQHSLVL